MTISPASQKSHAPAGVTMATSSPRAHMYLHLNPLKGKGFYGKAAGSDTLPARARPSTLLRPFPSPARPMAFRPGERAWGWWGCLGGWSRKTARLCPQGHRPARRPLSRPHGSRQGASVARVRAFAGVWAAWSCGDDDKLG